MKTLLSCEFNMDTGCVELRYSDDSMISINCTAVEDEVANSRFQQSELDGPVKIYAQKDLQAPAE